MRWIGHCLTLALMLNAVAAAGDDGWGNWQLLEENDTFARPGLGSDAFYTQGLRLVFTREPDETWKWTERAGRWWRDTPWGRLFWQGGQSKITSSLVVAENHFTPAIITTFEPDPTDRPFAAVLYGGVRIDMTGPVMSPASAVDKRLRITRLKYQALEFDAGLLGPPALGRPLQAGFHVLREHRLPKGWPRQLGTEPVVNALWANRIQWGLATDRGNLIDITPDVGVLLGTLQTYPAFGATARVGWRMTGMSASAGINTAYVRSEPRCPDGNRCSFEIGLLGGWDGRYFLRNAFYDGSLIGGAPSVDKDRFVHDLRYGAFFRFHSWRFSYTAIRRSREFSPVPREAPRPDGVHDFGSISITREFIRQQDNRPEQSIGWGRRDWLFDFGLGIGDARLIPEAAGGRATDAPSGRVGFAKGIVGGLMAGFELTGASREGPRDLMAGHNDTFLTTQAFVVSFRPFHRTLGQKMVAALVERGHDKGDATRAVQSALKADRRGRSEKILQDALGTLEPGETVSSSDLRYLERPLGTLRLKAGVGLGRAKYEVTNAEGLAIQEETEKGLGWNLGAEYTFHVGDQLSVGLGSTWGYLNINERRFDRASFLSTTVCVQYRP